MKKSILMLAAMSFGTMAVAQMTPAPADAGAAQPPAAAAPADPAAPAAAAPTPDASAPSPMAPSTTAAPTDQSAGPGAPASGMSGASSGGGMGAMSPNPTPVDSANLPTCSRTVTDRCIQKGAGGGRHHAARKRR